MVDETQKPLAQILRNVARNLELDENANQLQQLLETVDDKRLLYFLNKYNVVAALSEPYQRLNTAKDIKTFESIDQSIRVPLL